MTSRRFAAALALLALASGAHAMGGAQDCQPDDLAPVDAWFAKQGSHARPPGPPTLLASACKASTVDKNLLIVAAAYDSDTPDWKHVVVAQVDRRSARVRRVFRGTIDIDASMVLAGDSLHIDTARYDLASGVRAFGVDVHSGKSGPRCAEANFGPLRSLFVQQGASLRLVLSSVMLDSWRVVGGNPCPPPATDGEVELEHTAATIAVSPHATHGLADLVLVTTVDSTPPAQRSTVLKYDGTAYGAKNWQAWGEGIVRPTSIDAGSARRP